MLTSLVPLFEHTLNRPMPPFHEALAFVDLPGWDSVVHLTLLLTIESELHIAFTSEEMVKMKTLGDLLTVLTTRGITC